MTYRITTIPAFRTDAITTADYAKKPDLATLQRGVGGLIETVPHWTRYQGKRADVYCNEEGRLHGLTFNRRATALWIDELVASRGGPIDPYLAQLFGDVIIVQKVTP